MGRTKEQDAVVIGASIAGLCAARVLSDHYRQVIVFERDELPSAPAQRAAVPQGRHVHLLMARGAAEFDGLFPGLLDDMVAAGVPMLENRPDCIHFGAAGHVLGTDHTLRNEFTAYVPSRPHLEWQIRRRVEAIPNVQIRHVGVAEPCYSPAEERVTGVLLDANDVESAEDTAVPADLVVDATGRGTRLPVWLQQWGFERPPEETVDVGIGYASQQVRIPAGLIEEKVVVAGACREQPLGLGMLYYEDHTWTVTTFGIAKVEPPQRFTEMCALADDILPAHVSAALRAGTPVGDVAFHKYPVSRWRRYDKLSRFPTGIIPFGDAVVSFNPTFGQGMTMSSIQARNLRTVLECGDSDIATRLAKATAKTTYPVWTMTAIGDQVLHLAPGPKPWWYGPVGGLFDQFLGAAETDPVLAEWFLRRFSLLDSLYMVPSPTLVSRTVRHNMRLWWAQRAHAKAG
ncbi:FAD-dependent oxidoreductase [Mycolicibacterium komossense]|uniref:Oxidoreductase n=1 Tax=Mycolicibacterium komossense TaxID=1779 RepID=A0ABT3CCD6_9MYCO|nr:NAD(P)-binding protein [Mycolicibacterium komossense]MCV7227143.1 oxidoreductase [Mycolicibacterium komossense]